MDRYARPGWLGGGGHNQSRGRAAQCAKFADNFQGAPGVSPRFDNAGTFRQISQQRAPRRSGHFRILFNNYGLVDIQSGTLAAVSGGFNGGSIHVAAGTAFNLANFGSSSRLEHHRRRRPHDQRQRQHVGWIVQRHWDSYHHRRPRHFHRHHILHQQHPEYSQRLGDVQRHGHGDALRVEPDRGDAGREHAGDGRQRDELDGWAP